MRSGSARPPPVAPLQSGRLAGAGGGEPGAPPRQRAPPVGEEGLRRAGPLEAQHRRRHRCRCWGPRLRAQAAPVPPLLRQLARLLFAGAVSRLPSPASRGDRRSIRRTATRPPGSAPCRENSKRRKLNLHPVIYPDIKANKPCPKEKTRRHLRINHCKAALTVKPTTANLPRRLTPRYKVVWTTSVFSCCLLVSRAS